MNIKPDDKLVCQTKSTCGNEGLIGEVLEFLGERPFYDGAYWSGGEGPCWLVRFPHPVRSRRGTIRDASPVPDAWLRPIRDQPGNESWFKAAPISTPTKPTQTVPQPNAKPLPQSV